MKGSQVYDEKQLQDRGKVYQISFVAALLSIACAFFVTQVLELKISGYALFLFCMWIPVVVCLILLIWKNAYEGVDSKAGRITISVVGAGGVMLVVSSLWELCSGQDALFRDGVLEDRTGTLFAGVCMVIVCCVYWLKQYVNKKNIVEE